MSRLPPDGAITRVRPGPPHAAVPGAGGHRGQRGGRHPAGDDYDYYRAWAIDASGRIASSYWPTRSLETAALVWSVPYGDRAYAPGLPGTDDPAGVLAPSGFTAAYAVADDGRVRGAAVDRAGAVRPVVWICAGKGLRPERPPAVR
ncbi:hypothetical protein ACIA6C_13180 [Streptomyces sp. NPDC051578]|uniref:hypothetical protein n=1 Tax=Streptomyces sp. NPDC051578 TaxID=3365662 RepID=UPI00379AF96E